MAIDTNLPHSNLTKEERLILNSLRDDTFIIINKTDKGLGVVVWDRKDYLNEAETQLGDKETYEELSLDPVRPLISIVRVVSRELRVEVIYLMKLWNTFL